MSSHRTHIRKFEKAETPSDIFYDHSDVQLEADNRENF